MILKDEILDKLNNSKGTPLSGEQLGKDLGVSRAAIWKNIKVLQNEGFEISATTNLGYVLSENTDILSENEIKKLLEAKNLKNVPILIYNSIHSTNRLAKEMILSDVLPYTTIIANTQTEGRGRMGKDFFSPPNTGIYMSIILKPSWDISKSTLLTVGACVAVKRAIRNVVGKELEIKWVNDLFYKKKKVCGILTEAMGNFESGSIDYIILGIGINLFSPKEHFPDEINNVAGTLVDSENYDADKLKLSRNLIISEVISEVLKISDTLNPDDFIDEYRNSSFILGHSIEISKTKEIVTAREIGDEGELIVEDANGNIKILNSGEVSIIHKF